MAEPTYALSDGDVDDLEDRDDDWEEDWGEIEGEACTSLFCSHVLPTVAACCEYDQSQYGFDIKNYRSTNQLDDYETIKCINYIRAAVKAGEDPLPDLKDGLKPFNDDKYFQPVMDNDSLLFHDFAADYEQDSGAKLQEKVLALQAENEALQESLHLLKIHGIPEELRYEAQYQAQQKAEGNQAEASTSGTPQQPPAPTAPEKSTPNPNKSSAPLNSKNVQVDKQYFDSYSYFDIHRDMLEDRVRTLAYRDALEQNPALLKGATVLDLGCGTGILSMFSVRGGASKVIAIDGSERIAEFAVKNITRAGMSASTSGPITVVAGKVEELESIPVPEKSVDVLVSEWMGYALLFESMLDSVLYARDRWLKPGGAMMPDKAIIYIAAGSEQAIGLTFWDDVYGFNMSDIKEDILSNSSKQPLVAPVKKEHLLSPAVPVKEFDLVTMSRADADFNSEFELAPAADGKCHCVVLWFDTPFSKRFCSECPINLSTSPMGIQTHWAQTVLVLQRPIPVTEGGKLAGRLSFAQSGQHRSLDMSLEMSQVLADGSKGESVTTAYVMEVTASD